MVRIKQLDELLRSKGFEKHALWQFWQLDNHWVRISKDEKKKTCILYDGGKGTHWYCSVDEFVESEDYKAIIKEKHFKQFDL